MKTWDSIVQKASSVYGIEQFGPLVIPSESSFYSLMVHAVHESKALGENNKSPIINIESFVNREEWLRNYGAFHVELLRQYEINKESFLKSIIFCSENLQFCSINGYVRNYLVEAAKGDGLGGALWEGCFSDGVEYLRSRVLLDRMTLIGEDDYDLLSSNLGDEAVFRCGRSMAESVLLVLRLLDRNEQLNSVLKRIQIADGGP